MTPELLDAILSHAKDESPRESCGVVLSAAHCLAEYVPCRNTKAGDEHFQIDPEDCAAAEDRGSVLAVIHSHPGQNPLAPSGWDIGAQRESGIPWYVVQPDLG